LELLLESVIHASSSLISQRRRPRIGDDADPIMVER